MNNPIKVIVAAYLSFQWLQVSMTILVANLMSVDLGVVQVIRIGETYIPINEQTRPAILFGLAALVATTIGFRLLAPRLPNFRPELRNLSLQKLFIVYLALFAVSQSVGPFTGGGLAQPLLVLGWLRFVPAVLLLVRWLTLRDGMLFLLAVGAIEIVTGFLGYFSGFRVVFFVMGAATLALHHALQGRVIRILAAAAVVTLLLGSVWTAIKPTYRETINLGTGQQRVLLSVPERLELLTDLLGRMSGSDLADGFAGLAVRISYVHYLADAMLHVPRMVPHENGALWGEAITNTTMPRAFFPGKPVLGSDSARTNRYTGRRLAGDDEGTSVSMGYVADSYVDFGVVGALLVCLALGAFYGAIARTIVFLNRDPELTALVAVLVILFFPIQDFGVTNTKLLGGIVWRAIVCSIFMSALWPRLRDFCARQRRRSLRPRPAASVVPARVVAQRARPSAPDDPEGQASRRGQ
ncbi:MAG: hypothetical protein ACRED5_08000 [Propylenella sp.]